jgi:hypothetical protein
MTYSFFTELTESKLIPSYWHVSQYSAEDIGNLIYLYCMGLHVLATNPITAQYASEYARKTIAYGDFNRKANSSTDLYVMLYALRSASGFKDRVDSTKYLNKLKLDWYNVTVFLQDISRRIPRNHRSFLLNLDSGLNINDSSLKAIRRTVMDWEQLPEQDMRLALARLTQKLRSLAPKSEILPHLEALVSAV